MEKRKKRGISPNEMAFRPKELHSLFEDAGYSIESTAMRDFLHPSTPKALIPFVNTLGKTLESMPVIKMWSGSIWIQGTI
jgi:hypothetical protein